MGVQVDQTVDVAMFMYLRLFQTQLIYSGAEAQTCDKYFQSETHSTKTSCPFNHRTNIEVLTFPHFIWHRLSNKQPSGATLLARSLRNAANPAPVTAHIAAVAADGGGGGGGGGRAWHRNAARTVSPIYGDRPASQKRLACGGLPV